MKFLLHDSRTGVKESSQKDNLVSELGESPRNTYNNSKSENPEREVYKKQY